jgi:hypothetical protein
MERPYRNVKQHNQRRRRLAAAPHSAMDPCAAQDEDTLADAVKMDNECKHKDLSVNLASDASNPATARSFRPVRHSARLKVLFSEFLTSGPRRLYAAK